MAAAGEGCAGLSHAGERKGERVLEEEGNHSEHSPRTHSQRTHPASSPLHEGGLRTQTPLKDSSLNSVSLGTRLYNEFWLMSVWPP